MADEKFYLDLEGLGYYDEKAKADLVQKEAATLQSAKDYADSLGSNYDAAGSAATAKAEAISEAGVAAEQKNTELKTELEGKIQTAQNAADTAQQAVEGLATYVGTIPEGATSSNVVAYIQEKTAGIATDENLEELTSRVATLEGADQGKSVREIAALELAEQLIPENAQASLDTLQEIAAWIQSHPEDAASMQSAISSLGLKTTLPEGYDTIQAYVDAMAAEVSSEVTAEKTRAENAETQLSARISDLEGQFGDGEGSIAEQIAAAVKEAQDYTDTSVSAVHSRVQTAENKISANETAISNNAAAIAANETAITKNAGDIAAIQAKVDSFTRISNAQIDALFA